jgi:uncharacterized membrane protein
MNLSSHFYLSRTTAAFVLIRGNETKNINSFTDMIQPLAIVSLPAVAFGVYYQVMPPVAMRFGVLSCILLHTYDRMWKPNGANFETMPHAQSRRRVW